uniref:Uncharacterized protein n=1 Tax=Triticum urartu TaxID=4572 RepID=A0A8R7QLK7_TRIUA
RRARSSRGGGWGIRLRWCLEAATNASQRSWTLHCDRLGIGSSQVSSPFTSSRSPSFGDDGRVDIFPWI